MIIKKEQTPEESLDELELILKELEASNKTLNRKRKLLFKKITKFIERCQS